MGDGTKQEIMLAQSFATFDKLVPPTLLPIKGCDLCMPRARSAFLASGFTYHSSIPSLQAPTILRACSSANARIETFPKVLGLFLRQWGTIKSPLVNPIPIKSNTSVYGPATALPLPGRERPEQAGYFPVLWERPSSASARSFLDRIRHSTRVSHR